jgi:hypothetical protein
MALVVPASASEDDEDPSATYPCPLHSFDASAADEVTAPVSALRPINTRDLHVDLMMTLMMCC